MKNEIYDNILDYVGNTPIIKVSNKYNKNIEFYAKLEGYNPNGSVKDRAAAQILKILFSKGIINNKTTIIESSSGNYGISLASYCKRLNLKFICVIDPKIQLENEELLKGLGTEIIKVNEVDNAGGYLNTRIKKINEMLAENPNLYWINQYKNYDNAMAYASIGKEILDKLNPDYIFLGVSSGSTITGVSIYIKNHSAKTKIIAVDIEGSVVFSQKPKNRFISGIGSSIVPEILKEAKIDDVVIVTEKDSINMCRELLLNNAIFAGGSSGSVYAAVSNYFADKIFDKKPKIVGIFADRGDRYCNTVYNDSWCAQNII